MTASSPEDKQTRWGAILAAAALAGAVAGLAAVYGIGAFQGNAGVDPACRQTVETARRIAPLVHGDVAAITVATEPKRIPDVAFRNDAGQPKTLADWRGRYVLLNLWATWCVPCRKEMPALDGLEAKLGGPKFEVVAVNIDTRDADKARTWLKDVGISRLAYYADPSAKVFQDLKVAGRAFGMPTTILVDPQGCEIGSLAGPAEWSGEDAVKLITATIAP
ncbi:MAG TPA: TlpA disulfide reductase family protein [Xanthobacteraceae bacterium]|jgi:thiol-disulfide isomerase/thioredoxin|nr:TlpA disulfide reductase family protein [Xanthobacteraceae bacterium]